MNKCNDRLPAEFAGYIRNHTNSTKWQIESYEIVIAKSLSVFHMDLCTAALRLASRKERLRKLRARFPPGCLSLPQVLVGATAGDWSCIPDVLRLAHVGALPVLYLSQSPESLIHRFEPPEKLVPCVSHTRSSTPSLLQSASE